MILEVSSSPHKNDKPVLHRIEVVSKLLGHADIATTAKHYVRPREQTLQEAGRLMERRGTASLTADVSTFVSAPMT